MKKIKIFLGIAVIAGVVSALGGAENANAASAYDSTLIPRSNIIMQLSSPSSYCSDEQEEPFDLTIKWPEILFGSEQVNNFTGSDKQFRWLTTSTVYENYRNSWDNKTYWGVMQDDAPGSEAYIWWTDDPNATGVFSGDALPGYSQLGLETPTSGKKYWAIGISMSTDYSCDIAVRADITGDDGQDTWYGGYNYGDGSAARKPLFIYIYDIQYPPGYDGEEIPDSTPMPVETSDWTPNFYVSIASDWKASIHDQNFNTFDGNPFLCDGEFAPILHYELWDRTVDPEVMLTSGYQSATAQIDYQFSKKPIEQDFRIIGWYECGGDGELEFSESSYKDFTIDGRGNLFVTGLETCVQETFPFLNWNGCVAGLNDVLATLAFNLANPVNSGVTSAAAANPNSCYTMQVLDDWIGVPNVQICAAFSSTVRNIVTPFVTFVLGALVFSYISRSKATVIS